MVDIWPENEDVRAKPLIAPLQSPSALFHDPSTQSTNCTTTTEMVCGGRLADSIVPTQFPATLMTSTCGVVGEVGELDEGESLPPPQPRAEIATIIAQAKPRALRR